MQVIRSGANTSFYVNNVWVGSFLDGTHLQGYVGLATSAYAPNFQANYDNFSVSGTGATGTNTTSYVRRSHTETGGASLADPGSGR